MRRANPTTRSPLRRRLMTLLAGAAIACTTLLASAPAAFADPWGGNPLDGRDPIATGCVNDAYTVVSIAIYNGRNEYIGYVNLRYSPRCGTNWSQVHRVDGARVEQVQARITRPADGYSYEDTKNGYLTVYSPMVYARWTCAYAEGFVDQSYKSGGATTACY